MGRGYQSKQGLQDGDRVLSIQKLIEKSAQAVCLYYALREKFPSVESTQMSRFDYGQLIGVKDPAYVSKLLSILAAAGWIEKKVVVVPEGAGWARKVRITFARVKNLQAQQAAAVGGAK